MLLILFILLIISSILIGSAIIAGLPIIAILGIIVFIGLFDILITLKLIGKISKGIFESSKKLTGNIIERIGKKK